LFTIFFLCVIPKPVWAVGFALEQTLRDATLSVFSFLILKRLQHKEIWLCDIVDYFVKWRSREMSNDVFQIICGNCGSKLNAKLAIIGQTRNCPKCKNPILIERPEPPKNKPTTTTNNETTITQPEIAPPIGSGGNRLTNLPERLDYRNRYIIVGSDRVIAAWESGRGWQVNVGNGFAPAKKNVAAIPDQGTFALAELIIGNPENNMTNVGTPTALNVFKISIRGALTALYRDENEILRKVDCEWSLTKQQQTILWNYLTRNFNIETIAPSRSLIVSS
jgi:hypothetical protein